MPRRVEGGVQQRRSAGIGDAIPAKKSVGNPAPEAVTPDASTPVALSVAVHR